MYDNYVQPSDKNNDTDSDDDNDDNFDKEDLRKLRVRFEKAQMMDE